jgi:hypothetical protein
MGGPYVEIALGKEPSAEDRLKVKALVESMNIRPSKREIWPAFSIVSTKLIGGSYEDKGRRFGIKKGKGRFFEITWITGEEYIEENEDFPSLHNDVFRHFALLPCAGIGLQALGNQKEDYKILGELALYLAKMFKGLIDFGGVLLPPMRPERWNQMSFGKLDWVDVCEATKQWLQTMPGRIIAIPYQTANDRTWATHICDAEFMAAWLQHPGFYIIK